MFVFLNSAAQRRLSRPSGCNPHTVIFRGRRFYVRASFF